MTTKRITFDKSEAEFIVPLACGKTVWTSYGSYLGLCTREAGHGGGHTHLVDRTIIHNVHKQTGLTYYATAEDSR